MLEEIEIVIAPEEWGNTEQIEQAKAFAQEWKATHPPLSYFPEKLGF